MSMSESLMYEELEKELKENNLSKSQLSSLKNRLCKKYKVKKAPTDIQILLNTKGIKLRTKPIRTGSGVAVIATMTSPFPCPHGRCTYCPGGIESHFGTVPQSYTGKEPSTLRAIRNNYDPYLIVMNRLEHYIVMDHNPSKVEQIVMGGTFLSFPEEYRDEYMKFSFKAMNDFSELFYDKNGNLLIDKFKKFFLLPGTPMNEERVKEIQRKLLELKDTDITTGKEKKAELEKEKTRNETSFIKQVACCFETKPDICKEKHINDALRYGCTRIELGVQTTHDKILKEVHRGHDLNDTKKAIQLLKDSLIKVGFHMMPGLPGVTKEMDIESFKEIFENPEYRPDAIKIYPAMVFPGTPLYNKYKKGEYVPLSTEDAAELIVELKKYVPRYCRIMRVQRDIPSYQVEAGVKRTNLRQMVDDLCVKKGVVCKCIRCREPKAGDTRREIDYNTVKLKRMDYDSSGGREIFLYYEDKNGTLVGFCRLRIPNKPFRKEFTKKSVGIRELHIYGSALSITNDSNNDSNVNNNKNYSILEKANDDKSNRQTAQHKGYGQKLLKEAEKIAKEEFKCSKMLIISGIGAKEYYRKFGYKNDGMYMSKRV